MGGVRKATTDAENGSGAMLAKDLCNRSYPETKSAFKEIAALNAQDRQTAPKIPTLTFLDESTPSPHARYEDAVLESQSVPDAQMTGADYSKRTILEDISIDIKDGKLVSKGFQNVGDPLGTGHFVNRPKI
jgi:hypothetical protein